MVAVEKKKEVTKVKIGSAEKPKKDKSAKEPKKLSGYMLFCKESREKCVSDNPEMKSQEIMKELGRLWQALSTTEKECYKKKCIDEFESVKG